VFVRIAVIIVVLCGGVACFYFLPSFGTNLTTRFPEYADFYYPWLIFLWIAAAPCFFFLALVWKLSTVIKREQVFTHKTAQLVKTYALILSADVIFFVMGNIVFLLLDMNHPVVLLLSVIIAIFGLALAVLVATLSRYLTKAAALQEEVDSTI
jgi:hypothetical protein